MRIWATNKRRKKKIVEDYCVKYDILKEKDKRQLAQGGCEQSYKLTSSDYNFAFAAQELGYGYAVVAQHLKVGATTVKDWFSGRSRKKEKEAFDKLSNEDKEALHQLVEEANLIYLMHDKLGVKNEDDVLDFLCYDEEKGSLSDTAIERLYGWPPSTIYHMRKSGYYPISKQKVSKMSQEEKQRRKNRLIGHG